MIRFRKRTLWEGIKYRFWMPYRERIDADSKAAIRTLVENPEAPCIIGDTFIRDGYGSPLLLWNPNTSSMEPYSYTDDQRGTWP